MKYLFSVLVILIAFLSCETVIKDNSDQFKTGVFEIPSGKGFVKETIIRKDSIQSVSMEIKLTPCLSNGRIIFSILSVI